MARPTNEVTQKQEYLKEQCRQVYNCLNNLEELCSASVVEQKEELIGKIGLYVGKLGVRFQNIVERMEISFEEDD